MLPGIPSAHFPKAYVRTLDRGFDGNEYYKYFLKKQEKFVIRAKKNRNVIYNGKTLNIMDVAKKYKGNYRMDFMDKHGKKMGKLKFSVSRLQNGAESVSVTDHRVNSNPTAL